MHFHLFVAAVVLVLALSAAGTGVAAPPLALRDGLEPHKALYDIELTAKRSGSQIVDIKGQMFYEWKPGCEAFTTDHRFNLLYEYTDSPQIRITSDFSTYEPYDGQSFDFTSRRKRNGELYQEIRGRAERDADGSGFAVYSIPDGLSFALDSDALFPMAHSLALLERAEKGEKFYRAVIFDGSDEDGPVEINAFIGKAIGAPAKTRPVPGVDVSLLNGPAWEIRMAFFPLLEPGADAEYEMDVLLHKNGVISDMTVEYRDFTVTQKLAALERIKREACENNK